MTKINHEEYEILKSLRDSWKWIARDNDTILWVYENEPRKHGYCWDDLSGVCESVDSDSFQFIQWGDKNPFGIAELIEEYEKGYKGSWEHAIEFSEELFGESKEAEMNKDIEWAIKEIEGLETEPSQNYPHDEMIEREIVLGILNQLDEPEALSPDWIGDNVEYAYYMTPRGTYSSAKAVIDPNKLENLLVPKQEKVKIPYFIEEHIQTSLDYSEESTVVGMIENHMLPRIDETETDPRVLKFFNTEGNIDLVALAMITENYEVEEEQKYVVKLPTSKNNDNQYAIVDYSGNIWVDALPSKYILTEEEIRGLTKGDILFEHFAVKAEELKKNGKD